MINRDRAMQITAKKWKARDEYNQRFRNTSVFDLIHEAAQKGYTCIVINLLSIEDAAKLKELGYDIQNGYMEFSPVIVIGWHSK